MKIEDRGESLKIKISVKIECENSKKNHTMKQKKDERHDTISHSKKVFSYFLPLTRLFQTICVC